MDAAAYIKKPEFTDGVPDASDGMTAIHAATANTEGILDFLKMGNGLVNLIDGGLELLTGQTIVAAKLILTDT